MNPHSIRIALLTVAVLAALFAQADDAQLGFDKFQTGAQEERHVTGLVTEEIGPPANQALLSEASKALNEVASRLEVAINARIRQKGWGEQVHLRFNILSSPGQANAFAVTGAIRAGSRRHYIYLTSDLLNVMLQDLDGKVTPESVRIGIQELIPGILAHEGGHVIDNIDPKDSLSKRYEKNGRVSRLVSQAIETRTDAEAIELLKEAGLPPTGLHDAFERLKALSEKLPPQKRRLISAFLSTHPADDLRLLQQRLQLTADPFLAGASSVRQRPVQVNIAELTREIQVASAKAAPASRLNFVRGEGREEYFAILKSSIHAGAAQGAHYEGGKHYNQETSEAFWDLDEVADPLIRELKKSPPTESELATFRDLFGTMLIEGSDLWGKSVGVRKLVTEIPALRSQAFQESLLTFEIANPHYTTNVASKIFHNNSEGLQLLQLLWGTSRLETLKALRKPWTDIYEHSVANSPADWRADDRKRAWSKFCQALAKSDASPEGRLFLIDWALNGPDEKYLKTSDLLENFNEILGGSSEVSSYLRRLSVDRGPPEEFARLQRMANRVWNLRGEIGLLDTFQRSHQIDWEVIGQALGKTSDATRRELRSAIMEFARSKPGKETLKGIESKLKKEFSVWSAPKPLLGTTEDPEFIAWVNHESPHLGKILKLGAILADPAPVRSHLKTELIAALSKSGAASKDLEVTFAQVMGKYWDPSVFQGWSAKGESLSKSEYLSLFGLTSDIAQSIDASSLPSGEKRKLLREIFFDGYFHRGFRNREKARSPLYRIFGQTQAWMTKLSAQERDSVFTVLKKNGVYRNFADIVAIIRERGMAYEESEPIHLVASLSGPLVEEAGRLSTVRATLDFGHAVFGGLQKSLGAPEYPDENLNRSTPVSEIRNVWIEKLKSFPLTLEQKLDAFESMTSAGASRESEDFFRKYILADLMKAPPSRQLSDRVRGLLRLEEKVRAGTPSERKYFDRFLSLKSRAELIDHFIVEALPKTVPARNAVELVEKLLPGPSVARDDLLEKIAWKVQANAPDHPTRIALLREIEVQKSTQWSLYSPATIAQASTATDFAKDMDRPTRVRMIQYVMDPSGGLPESLAKAIDNYSEQRAQGEIQQGTIDKSEFESKFDQLKNEWRTRFHSWAQYASPAEKLVFIDAILNAGSPPLINEEGYPGKHWEELTGKPMSPETAHRLIDYLNSGSRPQQSPAVSYLLAARDPASGGTDLPRLFEAFETLGKKHAQLFSILGTFGEEASARLAGAKENARPMSVAQIWAAIEQLPESVKSEIVAIEGRLGSASIKTVVKVRMKDGSMRALSLSTPEAEAQVRAHAERARAFLNEVSKNARSLPTTFFKTMLDGVVGQIRSELDFSNEAKNTEKAHTFIEELNRRMGGKMEGWKFAVPEVDPRTRHLKKAMLSSVAPGKSLDLTDWGPNGLGQEMRDKIGSWIAEGNTIGLYELGFSHGDPHSGQFFIDPKTRTITWLDWGQVVELSLPEDRYALANLVRGISERNGALVVSSAKRLSADLSSTRSILESASVIAEMQRTLRTKAGDLAGSASAVLEVLAKHGIALRPEVSFGALKDILYLAREISPKDAARHLERSVSSTLASNPTESVKTSANACLINALSGFLEKIRSPATR